MSAAQFTRVATILQASAGIRMRPGKEGLVRARLMRRLHQLGMEDLGDYLQLVEQDRSGVEFTHMIDALTTNTTSFLREPAHFDFIRDHILPGRHGDVRIWSAGCSTGEEAYSLAMVMDDARQGLPTRTPGIVATDINQRVLAKAKAGCYLAQHLAPVPQAWVHRYWSPEVIRDGRAFRDALPSLKRQVEFNRLNLLEDWHLQGPFDAILCRNVMIYFDKPTQQRVIDRFWAMLRPGAHLLVGHSESLAGLRHRFRYVQPAVYAR